MVRSKATCLLVFIELSTMGNVIKAITPNIIITANNSTNVNPNVVKLIFFSTFFS